MAKKKEIGFKKLDEDLIKKVSTEVKMMLHAHRDCLRNKGFNTLSNSYQVSDGYFGEAFGIMRGLKVLGYGWFGSSNLDAVQENRSDNPHHNLRWWFSQLEFEVLMEEGFHTDHVCKHCLGKYRKDDATLIAQGKFDEKM